MFLDEATIDVEGGDGGNGAVAFRREKFVPRGGPNGGHGGKGGDVILVADENQNTLYSFRFTQRHAGGRGGHGGGHDRHGKNGEALRLAVPCGTVVWDADTGELIGDLVTHGQTLTVAKGGRGGRGNSAFKSPTHQAPREAENGEPGQKRRIRLDLKLIAEVGIIGLPNAGKSTLLAAVTAAEPKIADYPFTTLVPNLGVADIGYDTLVLADIPGLIEGASEGAGLGDRFLRHVERTRLLLHLVDGSAADPVADYRTINAELAASSPALAARPQVVAVTKLDLPDVEDRLPELRDALTAAGATDVHGISALTMIGVDDVLRHVHRLVRSLPPPEVAAPSIPVLRPGAVDEQAFTVRRDKDGAWRVAGVRVERIAAMTNFQNDDAVERFQRILQADGVLDILREHGVGEGDMVRFGEVELEWTD
ncbi:MAG: GTPase ObgE [Ardenticatenales bacterium]|nr:GTPase ObgE [Ardenticatenales bacterium]